ncbi:TonB-dependent receptor plug domain-containing protein [Longimicrobium terrae]|uniref:TonB-dependent receptor plug domain-containing protein n=1 Tax=Longimicrobium terrae TaxID=1639882 RepID=A0A841GX94_9BACT|nr:Plug domain-containing protein [Longimicrobium terrae]MBB4635232.1 hypothetical protein [Longimicrobium terrae]MBB6069626.1 hypothetical protein [Longimicrobium terrae]NNC31574.1 TonB-dependent receptor plug domain-containing protein [Longimicrobium terrae]
MTALRFRGARVRLLPAIVIALAWLHGPAAAQEPAGLIVLVQDEESAIAIPFAHVQIDSAGWMNAGIEGALAQAAAPGQHRVDVRARGYAERSFLVTVREEGMGLVRVPLARGAHMLDPVQVSVARTAELRDFYQRARNSATGRFLTRREIDRMPSRQFTDVLRSVAGVEVMEGPPRRVLLGGTAPQMIDGRESSKGCEPGFVVDGVPRSVGDADNEFRLEQIEGIEVYARSAFVPALYRTPRSCGVIVVWTR